MDVLQVFQSFNLDQIDDEWIRKTRSFDNLSSSNLPPDFLNILSTLNLSRLFSDASRVVRPWITSHTRTNVSWDYLVENAARPKALVCFLNHIISKAAETDCDLKTHSEGLKAAQFYFLMLAIPNSSVFCVYSSDLFCKSLHVVNTACLVWNASEQNRLPFISAALEAFVLTLTYGNVVFNEECIDAAIFTLSEVPRQCSSEANDSIIVSTSFEGLKVISSKKHGNIGSIALHIIRKLFPNFLLGFQRDHGLSNQQVNALEHQTLLLICDMLARVDKDDSDPFSILLKKLCTIGTDRNEHRQKACDLIIKLLRNYPNHLVIEFLRFLLNFTYNEIASQRLFAVEMLGRLLQETAIFQRLNEDKSPRSSCDTEDSDAHLEIPLEYLLFALFSRISDVAGSVRCRALTVLANCLKTADKYIMEVISQAFVTQFEKDEVVDLDAESELMDFRQFLKMLDSDSHVIESDKLLDGKAVVQSVIQRTLDNQVNVRRAAIQVLSRIISLSRKWVTAEILLTIGCHCRDTAISVRRSTAEYLTDLVVEYPDLTVITDAWMQSVFPLVEDDEARVSEKALECMEFIILRNLVEYQNIHKPEHRLPWTTMNALGRLQVRKFFTKACQVWGEKNILRGYNLLRIFKSHIGTENNIAVWSMMASMGDFLSIRDAEHFLKYFYDHIYKNEEADNQLCQLVMDVLAVICSALPLDVQRKLLSELESEMLGFRFPVTILSKSVEMMQTLTLCMARKSDRESGSDSQTCHSPKWAVRIAQESEKFIDTALQSHEPVIANEELFVRAVISMGETSLIAPNTVQPRTIEQIGRVIDPLSDHVPESSSRVKSGIVVAVGKMILQNEKLAIHMVGVFGRLLSSTDNAIIKNNVMIVLSDLTVRYTALVEDLLPEMCMCLKDPVRLVRENTLVLITRLIQEDYLKMKSALLFHLLSVLTDKDETLRAMASSFFVSALAKHKNLFQNHFAECLFYFNGHLSHEYCQRIKVTDRERTIFSLQGRRNVNNREVIYRFMLSQMDLQQRFKTQRLIVDSICGAAVEEKLELDSFGQDVLRDALFCLLAEESRLIPTSESEDDVPADYEDVANQALHVAKKKFISEVNLQVLTGMNTEAVACSSASAMLHLLCALPVVRRYVIESEVPIIVNLHQKLTQMHSPLAQEVIRFLHFQVDEYKADINEIFKNDPRKAKRIVGELKRYESLSRMNTSMESSDSEEGDSAPNALFEVQENLANIRRNSISSTSVRDSPQRRHSTSSQPTEYRRILSTSLSSNVCTENSGMSQNRTLSSESLGGSGSSRSELSSSRRISLSSVDLRANKKSHKTAERQSLFNPRTPDGKKARPEKETSPPPTKRNDASSINGRKSRDGDSDGQKSRPGKEKSSTHRDSDGQKSRPEKDKSSTHRDSDGQKSRPEKEKSSTHRDSDGKKSRPEKRKIVPHKKRWNVIDDD